MNRRKLFIGRFYGTYTVRKYEFSSNDSQNVGIVMGPNRKLYYKISPTNCASGDLVLFTLKDDSIEIDFIYPVKKALVIRNHDESDSKSVHEVDYFWYYKKCISLDNSCALTECYQEMFTDEEYEKLLSSQSSIIFPRHWGHGIFLRSVGIPR